MDNNHLIKSDQLSTFLLTLVQNYYILFSTYTKPLGIISYIILYSPLDTLKASFYQLITLVERCLYVL